MLTGVSAYDRFWLCQTKNAHESLGDELENPILSLKLDPTAHNVQNLIKMGSLTLEFIADKQRDTKFSYLKNVPRDLMLLEIKIHLMLKAKSILKLKASA